MLKISKQNLIQKFNVNKKFKKNYQGINNIYNRFIARRKKSSTSSKKSNDVPPT